MNWGSFQPIPNGAKLTEVSGSGTGFGLPHGNLLLVGQVARVRSVFFRDRQISEGFPQFQDGAIGPDGQRVAVQEDVAVRAQAQDVPQRVRAVVRNAQGTDVGTLRIPPRRRDKPRGTDLPRVVIEPLDPGRHLVVSHDAVDGGAAARCWHVLAADEYMGDLTGDQAVAGNGAKLVDQDLPTVPHTPAQTGHGEQPQLQVFGV